jgi:prepilin-type N-terminal cleavage/methylation domain-containing protein
MSARCRAARGFSLVELLVALALSLLVSSALFALLDPAGGAFQTQPEQADLQQRLRASADALGRDLASAGRRPILALPGSDSRVTAAAVFPMRIGRHNADAAGSFSADRITVWSVEAGAPQATVASLLPSATTLADIDVGAGCPAGDPSCGFRAGMTAIVLGRDGAWDLFAVTSVSGTTLGLEHVLPDSGWVFAPGTSVIAEATVHTYFTGIDDVTGTPRLLRYDAAATSDVPVVDHIVSASFDYFGDGQPPTVVPSAGPFAPARVTYGPPPPDREDQPTAYPPGENCAFARDDGGEVIARLSALAPGPALVPLTRSQLTDGPWCPDETSANRYDADLLRVRAVRVAVTAEAGAASLRGPAGPLFTRGGTARSTRVVPDRTVQMVVSPRALGVSR